MVSGRPVGTAEEHSFDFFDFHTSIAISGG